MCKKKLMFFSLILLFINSTYCTENSITKDNLSIKVDSSGDPIIPIAIIGSGPCGLSAAIYAGRAKIDHVVITGEEEGGKLTKASFLENWPGVMSIQGGELAADLRKQTENLGTKFINASVTSVNLKNHPFEINLSNGQKLQARSLVIGTGSKPNKLKCCGEDEYLGKGIAVCAYCDAPFFENKKVVVIGGGFAALREIGILKKYTPHIIVINKDPNLSGPKMLQNYVIEDPSIQVFNNHVVLEIIGDNNKVTGIKLKNTKSNKVFILPTDGVFISIGSKPNTTLFKGQLELNDKKQIVVNNTETSVQHVYAGGDVTDKSYHQAIMASAEGYACAMNAEKKSLCITQECKDRKESFAVGPSSDKKKREIGG